MQNQVGVQSPGDDRVFRVGDGQHVAGVEMVSPLHFQTPTAPVEDEDLVVGSALDFRQVVRPYVEDLTAVPVLEDPLNMPKESGVTQDSQVVRVPDLFFVL